MNNQDEAEWKQLNHISLQTDVKREETERMMWGSLVVPDCFTIMHGTQGLKEI